MLDLILSLRIIGLLAETAVPDAVSVISLVGPVTSLGYAVWNGWYLTTKTIPMMQASYADQIKLLTEKHANAVAVLESSHAQQLSDCRKELAAVHERQLQLLMGRGSHRTPE